MPIDCGELRLSLEAQIESTFRCKSVGDHLSFTLPLVHADGDFVSVHVFGESNLLKLTDLGASISRLRQMGLEPRRPRLATLLNRFGIELQGEALTTFATRNELLKAFLMMGQSISSLAAISYGVNTYAKPFIEIENYIVDHKIAVKRQLRIPVEYKSPDGPVFQHPQVDLLLQDELIMMTVPGNKSRLRKVDQAYKALSIFEKAGIAAPRITVFDALNPIDREDLSLLRDLCALIPSDFLKNEDPSFEELENIAFERRALLPPSLL
jgi:hypothetical protein